MTKEHRYLKSLVCCFLLIQLILATAGYSQPTSIQMEYIGTEEVPTLFNPTALLQDKTGFMWIGTADGLVRYDGYEYVRYIEGVDEGDHLRGTVRHILETGNGHLWVGTDAGLFFFDRDQERFIFYPLDENQPMAAAMNQVDALFEDSQGTLWIRGGEVRQRPFDVQQLFVLKSGSKTAEPLILTPENGERDSVFQINRKGLITEDSNGALWFASANETVYRYDPAREAFRSYRLDEAGQVLTVYAGRDHQIWIGTQRSVFHYEGDQDSLTRVPIGPEQQVQPMVDPNMRMYDAVQSIFQDTRGLIWVVRLSGLYRYDQRSGTVTQYTLTADFPPIHLLHFLKETPQGDLLFWHTASINHLFRYDRKKGKILPIALNCNKKIWIWDAFEPNDVLIDRSGMVWLAVTPQNTRYGGFVIRGRMKDPPFYAHTFSKTFFPQNIYEDRTGRIWLSGQGLALFMPEKKEQGVLSIGPQLSTDRFTALAEDRQGNIWFGSWVGAFQMENKLANNHFENLALHKPASASSHQPAPDLRILLPAFAVDGDRLTRWGSDWYDPQWLEVDLEGQKNISTVRIHWADAFARKFDIQASDDRLNWQTLFSKDNNTERMTEIKVNARARYLRIFCHTRNSSFGISIEELEVYGLPSPIHRYQSEADKPGSLPHSGVTVIFQDSGGRLWFGTNWGVARFRPADRSFELIVNNSRGNTRIIEEDRSGTLWIQFPDRLVAYQPETGKKQQFRINNKVDSLSAPPTGIFIDRKDRKWLLTIAGLYRYQEQTGRFLRMLPDYMFTVMHEDNQNRLWVGSRAGGLFQINDDLEIVQNYTVENGLAGMDVYSIEEDEAGKLWLGTSSGLSRLDPASGQIINYYRETGLHANLLNGPSFKDRLGNLYFSGDEGFTTFHPEAILPDTAGPRVLLTELLFYNDLVLPGQKNTPLSKSISESTSISLAHDQNVFTLKFATLNLAEASQDEFAVRLDGLDKAWNPIGRQRSVTYSGLAPGRYVFRVKAVGPNNLWESPETVLAVSIRPPWWRTNWAYTAYALLLFLGIYVFFQWRTYSLRKQRQLLRNRVEEQTQELRLAKNAAEEANEAKSAFLSTVSHELRTPLTSIVGFTKLNKKSLEEKVMPEINQDSGKAARAVSRIAKNLDIVESEGERLTNLINELLDLAKIESGKVEWRMEETEPAQLIEQAVSATTALFEEKPDLELLIDIPPGLPLITADRNRIIQVFINLISNAVKFTLQGSIKVGASTAIGSGPSELRFYVEDTGMGIPPEYQSLVFERFQQVADHQEGKPKGTGLGLPICKEIVEHHGGAIGLESPAPGQNGGGSVFFFTIPVSEKNST